MTEDSFIANEQSLEKHPLDVRLQLNTGSIVIFVFKENVSDRGRTNQSNAI